MKQKYGPGKAPAEQVLKDIRRQTRRHYSAEEKIRIVLEGLRGEENTRLRFSRRRGGRKTDISGGWRRHLNFSGRRRRSAGVRGRPAPAAPVAVTTAMAAIVPWELIERIG